MMKKKQALKTRFDSMIQCGAHWGHKSLPNTWQRLWYPEMSSNFLGNRLKLLLFNPTLTLKHTVKGLYFAALILRNHGRVLLADIREEFSPFTQIATRCSEKLPSSVSATGTRWIGGMLSNWETLSPRVSQYGHIKTRFENHIKNLRTQSPRFKKMQNAFPGFLAVQNIEEFRQITQQSCLKFRNRPDLLIVCQPEENKILMREAFRLKIPVLAFVDSNSSLKYITYPIPVNTSNHEWIYYCLDLLLRLTRSMEKSRSH